jgi:hypothetical protein
MYGLELQLRVNIHQPMFVLRIKRMQQLLNKYRSMGNCWSGMLDSAVNQISVEPHTLLIKHNPLPPTTLFLSSSLSSNAILLDLGQSFSFLILYTVGRTP